ncbi:extracellular solute-binding protein [Paenibacillus thermoaerophilus]|nr:extracellular solute-binding protein [Paenibacillus thermoaerophilus]TMV15871.1 extracellular solute-binding protein [Paenibacillus thermoaerophilus]
MTNKKGFASTLALILMLASVAAACSDNKQEPVPSSQAENSPSEQPLDKVTFRIFNGVAGEKDVNTNETRIGKILEEQTGVNFKIEHLVGDLNAKVGTMVAANEYPDVIIPDAAINQLLNAGAFIDLNPLIEKYGPNIKRVFQPYYNRMKAKDGGIYFLPFSTVVNKYIPDPNINQGGFWVQRRVLEWAGYPKIRKVDEYFKLIEDFIKAHPNEKLTGFVALTHDWRFFATTNVPNHLAGYPNDGEVMVDMQTHEAKIYAGTEYEKRWFKMLNEINNKGLFDKSSFVDNYDQYIAKLTSHKVLGFFDYGWQIGSAQNVLSDAAKADPSQDGYRYFALPVTFHGGKDQYLDPPGFVNNRGFGITVSAKDPVRIIKFIDNLLKEENQILVKWGVEGETYLKDEKGRMYRTQEMIDKMDKKFNEDYGFSVFDWDWPHFGTNSTLSNGNAASPGLQPEVFQLSLTEPDKKILSAYGVKTYSELFTPPDERPWFPAWGIQKEQGSPQQIFEAKKTEIQRKYIPELVLSTPDKFENVWTRYTTELNKLDIAGYEKWYTERIKEIVAKVKGQ